MSQPPPHNSTEPERLTLAQHLTAWLARARPTLKPSAYRSYEQTARLYLIPGLGHHRLARLNPAAVQAFLDAKRAEITRTGRPFSARSIAIMRDVLRQALDDAEALGLVPRNVGKLVRPPRGKVRSAQSLTTAQARVLLAAIRGDRLEALYRLCLALGLRQGEALGLHWADVDLDRRSLVVHEEVQRVTGEGLVFQEPKSAESARTIKLPQFLVGVLRAHKAQQNELRLASGPHWADQGLVFCTRTGRPFDGPNVTKYFQRHVTRAGLPHMTYHDLRHSAVSFMAAEGVPIEVARAILGHADARLTMNVYRHVLQEEHAHAADALDRLFARHEAHRITTPGERAG